MQSQKEILPEFYCLVYTHQLNQPTTTTSSSSLLSYILTDNKITTNVNS